MSAVNANLKRQKLVGIYNFWQSETLLKYSKQINYFALFPMSIMIFFDYVFLAKPLEFMMVRSISLIIMFFNVLFINNMLKREARSNRKLFSISTLFVPVILWNVQYIVFVYFILDEKFYVYFAGLLIVSFFSTFLLHRFWKLQYIYNFSSILIALPLLILVGNNVPYRDSLYIFIIIQLASGALCTLLRREFVGNLYAKYNLLKVMVPDKIARFVLTSDESVSHEKVFKPEERFTVCLCADWRGFQKLCSTKTSNEITKLLEQYYEKVIKCLEDISPDHNYFLNWTADELFIVFFNETDKRDKVIEDALNFTKRMIGPIYNEVHSEISWDIEYDIGLSAGLGLLGLQGPRQQKKTTITGEVAGRAKRLETEAKSLRVPGAMANSPNVVMDEALFHFASLMGIVDKSEFEQITAHTKDVENQRFYKWNPLGSSKKKPTLKIA